MSKQHHVSPALKRVPTADQRSVWERLANGNGASEERLRVWEDGEAWAVVDSHEQQWRFEFRSPTCNGTFEKPCDFRFLDLRKYSPEPPIKGAKLVLSFDANHLECRPIWPHLTDHLIEAIGKAWQNRPTGIIRGLKDWKNNWPLENGFKNRLLLQGLFGELCLIEWFLENRIAPEIVLRAWVGGNKRLHDFQFQGPHMEVKANASKRRIVTISDLRQLDESSARPGALYLAHIVLVKSEKKDRSLSALVERIQRKMTDSENDLLTTKLMAWRWYQIPLKVRDETIFFSQAPEFFTVIEGFPRLLGKDLRTGVTVTKYKIAVPGTEGEFFIAKDTVLAALEQRF